MFRLFKLCFWSTIVLYTFSVPCHANSSYNIDRAYAASQSSAEKSDLKNSYRFAKMAWKLAEQELGDHAKTGDMALHFATISIGRNYDFKGGAVHRKHKVRMKAYQRSIELASLHSQNADKIELERHLKRIAANLSFSLHGNEKTRVSQSLDFIEAMTISLNTSRNQNSAFAGDLEFMKLSHYILTKEYIKAVEAGKQAKKIYRYSQDDTQTLYQLQLPLNLSTAYSKAGDPIKAALEVQTLFHKLRGQAPPDKFQNRARESWIKNWIVISDQNQLGAAKEAGLCDCLPIEGLDGKPVALRRTPPILPAKSMNSGFAIVLFDLLENGTTSNFRVVQSTGTLFEKSALKAMKTWRYNPSSPQSNPDLRTDIAVKLNFTLNRVSGKKYPTNTIKSRLDPLPKTVIDQNYDTIETVGYRVKR